MSRVKILLPLACDVKGAYLGDSRDPFICLHVLFQYSKRLFPKKKKKLSGILLIYIQRAETSVPCRN